MLVGYFNPSTSRSTFKLGSLTTGCFGCSTFKLGAAHKR